MNYQEIFDLYKQGLLSLDDFTRKVNGLLHIEIIDNQIHLTPKGHASFTSEVHVNDVKKVISKYVSGDIEWKELNMWATILIMADQYEIESTNHELIVEVLHKIADSTDKLDSTDATYYLNCLESKVLPTL